jgi:prepilin-type N-terminal cleavage/methylation domain-containing protein
VSNARGFTLLEVLVALVILSLAIVTQIQLASQALRLVKLSGDHQAAVLLAERLARAALFDAEKIEQGREGEVSWERRIARVPVPDELTPPSGPAPQLLALIVSVRWGGTRAFELATLRASRAAGPGVR